MTVQHIRTQQTCTYTKVAKSFVFLESKTIINNSEHSGRRIYNSISRSTTPDDLSRYITHFNTSFLSSNSFTGSSTAQFRDVNELLRDSSTLQNAVIAVSALDVERREYLPKTGESPALRYYRASISSVQTDLLRPDLRNNASVLWSTFFLGIFELMCDTTGEGWIKHFLYGTSAMLQYRGPAAHLQGAGKQFFLITRVFEISRALIYSSESYLEQAEWRSLVQNMWSGIEANNRHPKEALLDLMTDCASLGVRAMKFIKITEDFPEASDETILYELAREGFSLRSAFSAWKESAQTWVAGRLQKSQDEQMTIALSYYHAISIYLSGIFDYHSLWTDRHISTPELSSFEIHAHVSAILKMVGKALKEGTLAAILFFFPLRVAGARARTLEQRHEISVLLHLISGKGFVVADAFVMDLDDLWGKNRIE
jgi:hypothetical protein